MNMNKTLKSIISVALSNCTTIVSGIIVGFLLPKVLSVDSYGLYKTFTLYATYIGFFSLGIIDGIVLDYGGLDYEQLNREKFRGLFKWYCLVHVIFMFVLLAISIFIGDDEYSFIIFMLGLNLVAVNLTGYFQQISQFTQRYKEFSIRKILQSVLNILIVIFMYLLYARGFEIGYQLYVGALVCTNILLTVWYAYTYKEISFGSGTGLLTLRKEIVHLIYIGFPLLFANLCSTLILTLDRQFVNLLFDNTTYAVYAFAYNMLSLVTVATSAVSTVLYPTLKRATKETVLENYGDMVGIMMAFVFLANAVYFPLVEFVKWYLPKYSDSLPIFRIIFPGLAISSSITVVMHNYYKVLGENLRYFKKSIFVLVFSGVANWIAYLAFKTTLAISMASIVTMILWYMYIEQLFVKEFGYRRTNNLLYLLAMMCAFYIMSGLTNMLVALLLYIIVFLLITYMLNKAIVVKMKAILQGKKLHG